MDNDKYWQIAGEFDWDGFSDDLDIFYAKLRSEWEILTEENRQLREAMEISKEEIAEKLYNGWYQAGVKQGGTLFAYEMDQRSLKEIKELFSRQPHDDFNLDFRDKLKEILDRKIGGE